MYNNNMYGMQPKVLTPQQQLTQYKKYLRMARSSTPLDLRALPCGELMHDDKRFLGLYKVKGISDPYYKQLNNELAFAYKRQRVKHNVYFNSGEIRERKVTQVPADCVPVLSDKVLGLPAKYEAEDPRLGYLDFLPVGDSLKTYIYVIPKEHLVFEKQTALVASRTLRKGHYGGYKVVLKNGHPIYLLVVDYKYRLREDVGLNIIMTARGLIPLSTVEHYITYLAQQGIGHSLDDCEGIFCNEIAPQKDYDPTVVSLDKQNLSEEELEELEAESFLDGLD